jgi:hypothetical protein
MPFKKKREKQALQTFLRNFVAFCGGKGQSLTVSRKG